MMYMADKASDDGSGIWVSKGNMSADLEMSVSNVRKHIKELLDLDIIFVAGHKDCKNGYTVNYTINLDIIEKLLDTRQTYPYERPLRDKEGEDAAINTRTPPQDGSKPSDKPLNKPLLIDVLDLKFNKFWEIYPRKVGKAKAKIAFKKAVMRLKSSDKLIQYATDYKEGVNPNELKFIPHAATWLNQERYLDEKIEPNFTTYDFKKALKDL